MYTLTSTYKYGSWTLKVSCARSPEVPLSEVQSQSLRKHSCLAMTARVRFSWAKHCCFDLAH